MARHQNAPSVPPFVRSLEHLMDFVDTAAVGLHWVAEDGTILWANRADYEALGYSADEYIGHNIREFHAEDDAIADILRRLAAGEHLQNYEARLKCKDGSVRDVQITSSVLFEETPQGKRFVHTRCYTQDVTERKRLEQARDRFVSILAHDLRNPLTSISVEVEHLLKFDDLAGKHRKGLERIHRAASRISRTIVDLIDFARRLGRHIAIEPQAIDFAEVCRRIVDEMQVAASAQVELKVRGNVQGEWDPERLEQAVSNLVRNAVHHGEPPFEVVVQDAGTDVLLKVSNCGPPIAQEALNSMFEPFSQMTSTDGLGLGLFIVSEIVSAHGGSIDVTSGPGASTVFVSRWPRSRGGRR